MNAEKKFVALGAVSSILAGILCFGGLLNLALQYELPVFRSVDLYSWAPSSEQTYRYFWGYAHFVTPKDAGFPNGALVKDVPGVQVFGHRADRLVRQLTANKSEATMEENELVQELQRKEAFRKWIIDSNPNDDAALQLQELIVVYHVTADNASGSWTDYFFCTNCIGVTESLYEDWAAVHRVVPRRMLTPSTLDELQYNQSILYWMLMAVPIVCLCFDVRVFTRLSSRQALFRPLPPFLLTGKRWLLDPLSVLSCFMSAKDSPLFEAYFSYVHAILLALLDPALTALSKRNWKRVAAVAMWTTLLIRTSAVVAATMALYSYETQRNRRIASTTYILFPQLLAANVLARILWQLLPRHQRRNDHATICFGGIESGLCKYVFSMHFYTAAATKLGNAGLRWIDGRYLAQLCLRGRYGDGAPYPLEGILLHAPMFSRDLGMTAVLVMELVAVFSWWRFDLHTHAWILFMVISTLSIGVPIRVEALGPLASYASTLAKLFAAPWAMMLVICVVLLVSRRRLAMAKPRSD